MSNNTGNGCDLLVPGGLPVGGSAVLASSSTNRVQAVAPRRGTPFWRHQSHLDVGNQSFSTRAAVRLLPEDRSTVEWDPHKVASKVTVGGPQEGPVCGTPSGGRRQAGHRFVCPRHVVSLAAGDRREVERWGPLREDRGGARLWRDRAGGTLASFRRASGPYPAGRSVSHEGRAAGQQRCPCWDASPIVLVWARRDGGRGGARAPAPPLLSCERWGWPEELRDSAPASCVLGWWWSLPEPTPRPKPLV